MVAVDSIIKSYYESQSIFIHSFFFIYRVYFIIDGLINEVIKILFNFADTTFLAIAIRLIFAAT